MTDFTPLTVNDFISAESDRPEEYAVYIPTAALQIFGTEYTADPDDADMCSFAVSKKFTLDSVLPFINDYLEWLSGCEENLKSYISDLAEEELPDDWCDGIEVLSFYFLFNGYDDYGVTVEFCEEFFCDHTIELDFDGKEITDCRLNG